MPTSENQTLQQLVEDLKSGKLARRDFLRRVVLSGATSAAAYALLNQTEASADPPRMTTMAIGEEGSPANPAPPQLDPPTFDPPNVDPPVRSPGGQQGIPSQRPQTPTTERIGEESKMTTMAIGEESRPPKTTTPTTMAVGEEATNPNPPKVTTKAIGEESKPAKQVPMTTLAVGEEGRGWGKPSMPERRLLPRLWNGFRRW
ncbi:hypothetical protein [Rhodopirellula sp. MGV]|uniref:hypothetical protein n=1 Tax=Rhodopirellula sp. MGV TaxID=2023130 RepID=UPI000B9623E7|nr:hypothetical protein [Rhodopirellula sp. MGV]OYP37047.1 hypothetical protein CGZ80_06765 [Rhodopirellula sp. MGV]PNY36191.1 hypothetical protein C2E31_13820 [Rhodopirellula baltica]